jgi:hypothetical protein
VLCDALTEKEEDLCAVAAEGFVAVPGGGLLGHMIDVFEQQLILVDCLDYSVDDCGGQEGESFEEQPAGTLGDVAAHHHQGQDAHPAQQEHSAPVLLVHHQGQQGGHGAPQVPGAVDPDIDSSPVPRRHELVDAREDGREFPSDTA